MSLQTLLSRARLVALVLPLFALVMTIGIGCEALTSDDVSSANQNSTERCGYDGYGYDAYATGSCP